jgi:transaldolase
MPEGRQVQQMFSAIAGRYDVLNHVLSGGVDFWWWWRMARASKAGPGMRFLDVAAGTGDSSLALARRGAEVVSTDCTGILREAHDLAKVHENIVVKIPMIKEGMKALKQLSGEGIRTNITLVFNPNQALVAAKLGATYVSPFVGRFDDVSEVGMELIADLVQIFKNYGFATQILVASCRHPLHIREAALLGAHVATMPYKVLEQLLKHPLTDIGLERFLKDWEKVKKAGS